MRIIRLFSIFNIAFVLVCTRMYSNAQPVPAKIWEVCQTGSVRSIAKAIELSHTGDVIQIKKGIYHEPCLIINHPLTIQGEQGVVIDNGRKGNAIKVLADNVTLNNLTIENSGESSVLDFAGVKTENAWNCCYIGLTLINNFFGLHFANCRHCLVKKCTVSASLRQESFSGNGIHCWHCDSMHITHNAVYGNRDGIYLEFTSHSTIDSNQSRGNHRYGLHFMFSNYNSYVGNDFYQNGSGIAVMYSHFIKIENNKFHDNYGSAAYGLLLKDITYSQLAGNVFTNNTVGLQMEGAEHLSVNTNQFTSNGYALRIAGDCVSDTFVHCNFLNNTFTLSSNASGIGDRIFLDHNYWDEYSGYDLDHNGIGDVGYRPVSLFSLMLESNPEAIVLYGSPLIHLLDAIERTFPSFIPETLEDHHPLMKPVHSSSQIL